jgi:hypothetical protein
MGRSRTASGTRGRQGFSVGRRNRNWWRLELRVRKTQEQAENKPVHLLPQFVILFLLTGAAPRSAAEEAVTGGLLHGFLPAVITDPSA